MKGWDITCVILVYLIVFVILTSVTFFWQVKVKYNMSIYLFRVEKYCITTWKKNFIKFT